MRHHFGDLLHRDGDYWTIIPNRERYAYRIGDIPEGSPEITIVTIGKEDKNWSRVLTLPNLEELTLHEPTPEQLLAVADLRHIKRLRITHARPSNIDFIASMTGVEELVMEYVSGFSDLSPLQSLENLRSLHLENLRRVSDFSGLSGAGNLRYLAIYGTTDWSQPIKDFEFLRGLPKLEVFNLWTMICRAPYPALLPALSLRNLKEFGVHGSYFATEEYALLEEGLKGVEGATWGPYRTMAYLQIKLPPDDIRTHLPEDLIRAKHPEVYLRANGQRLIDDPDSEWIEFTGKRAGRIKSSSPKADAKCREQAERYERMKQEARELIKGHGLGYP